MQLQDQLTRFERIRLESLSQSMMLTQLTSSERPTKEKILANAKEIEQFLLDANKNGH